MMLSYPRQKRKAYVRGRMACIIYNMLVREYNSSVTLLLIVMFLSCLKLLAPGKICN